MGKITKIIYEKIQKKKLDVLHVSHENVKNIPDYCTLLYSPMRMEIDVSLT